MSTVQEVSIVRSFPE